VKIMYLKKTEGPRIVTLPSGDVLTHADLPPADTVRWVASRKLKVVHAVAHGLIAEAEALTRYALSEEELNEWKKAICDDDLENLKATRQKKKNNL